MLDDSSVMLSLNGVLYFHFYGGGGGFVMSYK